MHALAKEMALTWGAPQWLWVLLLSIPLLIGGLFWNARRRNRTTQHLGKMSTVSPLIVGKPYWWRTVRGTLLVIGLALIIITLATPQYGSRTRVLRKQGIDIVIALDFSKSMLAQDIHPNRIDRAKAELSLLLNSLSGDRIGLVAFAGETIEFPMTIDHSAIRLFLRDLSPMDMPVGGTAISKALLASKHLLERTLPNSVDSQNAQTHKRTQVVILMTDGEDHEGDVPAAAEGLKADGIRLYTIGIGSQIGEPIPIYNESGALLGHMKNRSGQLVMTSLSPENEQMLEQISSMTGGNYISAPQGTVGIAELRKELANLEKSEQKTRRITIHENRFALALLPAFLLLVLQALLPEVWLFRRKKKAR